MAKRKANQSRSEFNLIKRSPRFRKWRFDTYIKQGGRCFACNVPMFLPIRGVSNYPNIECLATIDHEIPLVEGGENNYSNFNLICWRCNNKNYKPRMVVSQMKLGVEHRLEKYLIFRNRHSTPSLPQILKLMHELYY